VLNRKPLLLIIIFLFIILTYFITYEDAYKERKRIIEGNLGITSNISSDIDQFINTYFLSMEILGGIDDPPYVLKFFERYKNVSSFLVLDPSGKIVNEFHKELNKKEQDNLFHRYLLPYLQYPLSGERYVSNLIQSSDINEELIALASPLYDAGGKISGAVFLTIKIDVFIPLLKDYKIGKNGYVFIRDGAGNTIYHPQYELVKALNYKFFDIPLIPRSDHKIQKSSFDNEIKYVTYRPIQNADWMVFIMQPIDEYQSPIYLIWIKNGTLLLLLFLFVYILYHLGKKEKRLLQTQLNNERLEVVAEMAAGIAHEIKNPLVPIKGFIQLEKLKASSSLGQETIRLLLGEIDRIESIINDFMTLARNNQTQYGQVKLLETLKDVLSLMQVEADNKGIQLTSNVSTIAEKLVVYGDGNHLTQLFLNIIKNAMEASKSQEVVDVQVKIESKDIRITIKDTGQGIPIENLRKIGTPFYSTKEQGTGMGLAISQRIVKNHKGRMEITSQESKGTTVDIYLPTI